MSRVLNYITAPEVDEIVSNSQGGLVHDLARNVQAARRERDEAWTELEDYKVLAARDRVYEGKLPETLTHERDEARAALQEALEEHRIQEGYSTHACPMCDGWRRALGESA